MECRTNQLKFECVSVRVWKKVFRMFVNVTRKLHDLSYVLIHFDCITQNIWWTYSQISFDVLAVFKIYIFYSLVYSLSEYVLCEWFVCELVHKVLQWYAANYTIYEFHDQCCLTGSKYGLRTNSWWDHSHLEHTITLKKAISKQMIFFFSLVKHFTHVYLSAHTLCIVHYLRVMCVCAVTGYWIARKETNKQNNSLDYFRFSFPTQFIKSFAVSFSHSCLRRCQYIRFTHTGTHRFLTILTMD